MICFDKLRIYFVLQMNFVKILKKQPLHLLLEISPRKSIE